MNEMASVWCRSAAYPWDSPFVCAWGGWMAHRSSFFDRSCVQQPQKSYPRLQGTHVFNTRSSSLEDVAIMLVQGNGVFSSWHSGSVKAGGLTTIKNLLTCWFLNGLFCHKCQTCIEYITVFSDTYSKKKHNGQCVPVIVLAQYKGLC